MLWLNFDYTMVTRPVMDGNSEKAMKICQNFVKIIDFLNFSVFFSFWPISQKIKKSISS